MEMTTGLVYVSLFFIFIVITECTLTHKKKYVLREYAASTVSDVPCGLPGGIRRPPGVADPNHLGRATLQQSQGSSELSEPR